MSRFVVGLMIGINCGCQPASSPPLTTPVPTQTTAPTEAEASILTGNVDPQIRGKWRPFAADLEFPDVGWSSNLLFGVSGSDFTPSFDNPEVQLEVTDKEFRFGTTKVRVASAATDPNRTPKAIDFKLDDGKLQARRRKPDARADIEKGSSDLVSQVPFQQR